MNFGSQPAFNSQIQRTQAEPEVQRIEPRPGDIIMTKGEGGSIFISIVLPDGKHDWRASSTAMLRQRGVSRLGKGDYQPAADFTNGRVFDKGQAYHLIEKYLPEFIGQRILLRGQFFYTESENRPLIPMRKTRNA